MSSPYKSKVRGFLNLDNVITLSRDGAADLSGQVKEIEDEGCTLETEAGRLVFVAWGDIRGVVLGEAIHE